MSDDDCDERMVRAERAGRHGYAEFLATRCDLFHRRPEPREPAHTPQADAAVSAGKGEGS